MRRVSRRIFDGRILSLAAVITIVALGGCRVTAPTAEPTATAASSATATLAPTATAPAPTSTVPLPTDVPATPTPEPTPDVLPAEPQTIPFQAADGQTLSGTYYPAATRPAPCVVLMHWALGDETSWAVIAPWLQNRVDLSGISAPSDAPWHDYTWFPPVPDSVSYAVFTFTFRGCEGGCSQVHGEGWLLDARAAVETAKTLAGVDPDQLVTVGASIGADGAVNGCAEGCRGAFSLSPGSYLTVDYAADVARLAKAYPAVPVECLASEGDSAAYRACQTAAGDNCEDIIYPGESHGMNLVRPDVEPETLQVVLDFLARVLD